MKLSVIVMSYNFEHYIYDCLKSIVEQKVDFEYEVLVGDDCSKDSSAAIIMEFANKYPGLIRPIIHKTNIGAINNYFYLLNLAQCEYIAYCDGDDYMVPSKLQKQVDYLDSNDDCSMVVHPCYIKRETEMLEEKCLYSNKYDLNYYLENGLFFSHSSKVFRKYPVCNELFPDSVIRHPDYLLNIQSAVFGKIGYISEYLGVYRKHANGMSTHNSQVLHKVFYEKTIMAKYLISKNVVGSLVDRDSLSVFLSANHYSAAIGYLRIGDTRRFKYHMRFTSAFIGKKAIWKRIILMSYIYPKLFKFLVRI